MSILFLITGGIEFIYCVVINILVYKCLCFKRKFTNPPSLFLLNTFLFPIKSSKQK